MSELIDYVATPEDFNSVADILKYGWIVLVYPHVKNRLGGLSKLIPQGSKSNAIADMSVQLNRIEALLIAGASPEPINLGKEYEMAKEVSSAD